MAKVGEKVRCLPNYQGTVLQAGKVYEVVRITLSPPGYYLKGITYWYSQSYFQDDPSTPTVIKQVRCIDEVGYPPPYLHAGDVYQVVAEEQNTNRVACYKLQGMGDTLFAQDRFTIVIGLPTTTSSSTAPDLADWKVWRDHGRTANECPCGPNVRKPCPYH